MSGQGIGARASQWDVIYSNAVRKGRAAILLLSERKTEKKERIHILEKGAREREYSKG